MTGKKVVETFFGRNAAQKVVHPSVERYIKLSQKFEKDPIFDIAILQELQCVPLITAKQQKGPNRSTKRSTVAPLEVIHLDILG